MEGASTSNAVGEKGFMETVIFNLGPGWVDFRSEPRGKRPSRPKT